MKAAYQLGNHPHKLRRALLALLVMGTVAADVSKAESGLCRQLIAQAQGRDSAQLKRELRQAIRAADRRGCFGGFFFRGRGKGCGNLLGRVQQLDRALHQQRRPQSSASLKRELTRNGCYGDQREKSQAKLFSQEGGEFRTVCVRKCDGYFFPIGYDRRKSGFKKDRDYCHSIYGADAADLYVYLHAASPEQMRSLDGRVYRDEPFAFAYQREFVPACQVQLQAGLARIKQTYLAAVATRRPQVAAVPKPVPRPTGRTVTAAYSKEPENPDSAPRIIEGFATYLPDNTFAFSEDADDDDARRDALNSIFNRVREPHKVQ